MHLATIFQTLTPLLPDIQVEHHFAAWYSGAVVKHCRLSANSREHLIVQRTALQLHTAFVLTEQGSPKPKLQENVLQQ